MEPTVPDFARKSKQWSFPSANLMIFLSPPDIGTVLLTPMWAENLKCLNLKFYAKEIKILVDHFQKKNTRRLHRFDYFVLEIYFQNRKNFKNSSQYMTTSTSAVMKVLKTWKSNIIRTSFSLTKFFP